MPAAFFIMTIFAFVRKASIRRPGLDSSGELAGLHWPKAHAMAPATASRSPETRLTSAKAAPYKAMNT